VRTANHERFTVYFSAKPDVSTAPCKPRLLDLCKAQRLEDRAYNRRLRKRAEQIEAETVASQVLNETTATYTNGQLTQTTATYTNGTRVVFSINGQQVATWPL
jgi:hypothetical protein